MTAFWVDNPFAEALVTLGFNSFFAAEAVDVSDLFVDCSCWRSPSVRGSLDEAGFNEPWSSFLRLVAFAVFLALSAAA
jgi:hypothetical protein